MHLEAWDHLTVGLGCRKASDLPHFAILEGGNEEKSKQNSKWSPQRAAEEQELAARACILPRFLPGRRTHAPESISDVGKWKRISSPPMTPTPSGWWANDCSSLCLFFFFLLISEIATLRDSGTCSATCRGAELCVMLVLLIFSAAADTSG